MSKVKIFAIGALVLAATACGGGTTNGDNGGTANEVMVVDNTFQPGTLSVAAGTTVTWRWSGTTELHNVVADDQSFTSGPPTPDDGTTFSHTFAEAGAFGYVCQVHLAEMTGTINVT